MSPRYNSLTLQYFLLWMVGLGYSFQLAHAKEPSRVLLGLQHFHVCVIHHRWRIDTDIDSGGVLLMAQAAAQNFAALAALRVLSGAAEAIADPAFMLFTTVYYTRAEQPSRISCWYMFNGVGGE